MSEAAVPKPELGAKDVLRLRSDERLARRAARGDTAAFESIYKRYHQDLYRFCLAMLSRPQDAQDALQNTMVKALRALPGETREIKLKPWLYRIARNEAIELLRRRRDSAELGEHHPAPEAEVVETAEARERLRRLMADLEELPDRQRAMLVMRELGGVGFDQIGEAFDTSGSVARQTLYEARLSLREMEEGRDMDCDRVMRELSDADGRVTRRRAIRAHLRDCADCRAFAESITQRREELAAIAPLPLVASAGILNGVLGASASGGSAAGGGLVGTIGAGTGKVVAGSAVAKTAATVAVVAAVGVTAADRGGLIDVPLTGGGAAKQGARELRAPASSSGGGVSDRAGTPAAANRGRGDRGDRSPGAAADSKGGHGALQANGGSRPKHGRSRHHAAARSPSGTHGRPDQLPAASDHGQQTAASHKAPQAVDNPAQAGREATKAPPTAPARPAPAPEPEPEATPPPSEPPSKPEKPAPEGGGHQVEASPPAGQASG